MRHVQYSYHIHNAKILARYVAGTPPLPGRFATPLQEILVERDVMEFDIVIVGAGPAGLAAACRFKQLAHDANRELSIAVLEKGAELGAHVLSGALFDPQALDELFPDWRERGAPLDTPVTDEAIYWLPSERKALRTPLAMMPSCLHNGGNYVISAGDLCRWLGEQAEALGVDVFPGFAAQSLLQDAQGRVKGVITGDMGLDHDGQPRDDFEPGICLQAPFTLFAEGSRGHLGKQLIEQFALDHGRDAQHYAIGFKEVWEVPAEQHVPGRVIHATGWPLNGHGHGGSFLYHGADRQVMVGLIVDLDYRNPYLSPFDEFQRMKHHPLFADTLKGATRIAYGARSITKGGFNSLPKMTFPGGMLVGCDAGTLDFSRIKGLHMAMKSGMLAAESAFDALLYHGETVRNTPSSTDFEQRFKQSWTHDSLKRARSFGPALHRFGTLCGGGWNIIDQWLGGRLPTLHNKTPDYQQLLPAADVTPLHYSKPDGVLSFDKSASVYLANIEHDERQPCHLKLRDTHVPIDVNLPLYAEPAQRYCPAGVYEVVKDDHGKAQFRINAANCIHCKTCDIKDPARNITWTPPEGGSGPNYPNM